MPTEAQRMSKEQANQTLSGAFTTPSSTKQVAERVGLGYFTVRRWVQEQLLKGNLQPAGVNMHRENLFVSGIHRTLPSFTTPSGVTYTINDFMALVKSQDSIQFESSTLTNQLPSLFVELYTRAYNAAAGEKLNPRDKVRLRQYLERLRLALINMTSLVSQVLEYETFWDDTKLIKMLDDPDALTEEEVREIYQRLAAAKNKPAPLRVEDE